ncbi:MAG: RadC family protein [Bacteroidota bacterium]|jgi:DNA repair protein RadC|nr:DNA repair protein RadC [Algoriphagus sp.]
MPSTSLKIFEMAEQDRPREKLLLKGKAALTDTELVAILLRTGSSSMSAVDLSKKILTAVDQDLSRLARMTVLELMKFKGIGEAKALSIVCALELGRRRKDQEIPQKQKITHSSQVYELLRADLQDEWVEHFFVVLLNRGNYLIKKQRISQGGMSGTVVDPKVVFSCALEHKAHSLILVHNHPSGNLNPSEQDKAITAKLVKIGRELEVPVLDHLLFSDQGYFSFVDGGLM